MSVNVFLRDTVLSVILQNLFIFSYLRKLKVNDINNRVLFYDFECQLQSWYVCIIWINPLVVFAFKLGVTTPSFLSELKKKIMFPWECLNSRNLHGVKVLGSKIKSFHKFLDATLLKSFSFLIGRLAVFSWYFSARSWYLTFWIKNCKIDAYH